MKNGLSFVNLHGQLPTIHFVIRHDIRTNATSCFPQHQKGSQTAAYLYFPKAHVLIWRYVKVLKA